MIYDLAIIGGGPAGAAAAVYAARKKLKTVMITKDWSGQSTVSQKIENWIGTVAISGAELSKNLENHVRAYAGEIVDIRDGESCKEITLSTQISQKSASPFTVLTDKNSYPTKTILIASGSHRRKLNITGADKFEHRGLTYCATCDGPMFSGQDVAVIGGGNAAFESAAQLLAYCKSVTLLIRSGEFRADPGTIEKILTHPKMKAVRFAVPKEIRGDQFVSSLVYIDAKTGKDTEIKVTGIFVEIGSLPNTDFAKNIIRLDEFGRVVSDPRNQRTSVDGIWAAGDCTDGLYHQNNIAAGDAVKAIEDIYSCLRAK
jgi:NADH-dependent peroxiredoxin subunit F